MKLLITPAFIPSEKEKEILLAEHELFFIEDGRIPLSGQKVNFSPEEIEGIICNFFFEHNAVELFPSLKFVQLTSVGTDRVPADALQSRGIALFNAGSVYAVPMAEWTIAKILEVYKQSAFFAGNQKEKNWQKSRSVRELAASRAAIIGFGNVGKQIAKRLKAFDVTIHAVDIIEYKGLLCDTWSHISELQEVLKDADIVILSLPLNEKTYHLFDETMFGAMKKDAVLVNNSRGAILDETALAAVLKSGYLKAAVLDTFEKEPLPPESPLWGMENVLISPHNSFVGNGNHVRLFQLICENLKKFDKMAANGR